MAQKGQEMISIAKEMAQEQTELKSIEDWNIERLKKIDDQIEDLNLKRRREEKAVLKKHKRLYKLFRSAASREVSDSDLEVVDVESPQVANNISDDS